MELFSKYDVDKTNLNDLVRGALIFTSSYT